MRRVSALPLGLATAAFAAALGLGGAATAQDAAGATRGLRYLSWTGRAAVAAGPVGTAPSAEPARQDLRRPNRVIPHGGRAAVEPRPAPSGAPAPARRTLTPANAWLRPAAPPPAAPPAPAAVPASPPPSPAPEPQPVRPTPDYLPDQGGQPVPAGIAYPDAATPPSTVADPMAPRRDAPIFRMQQSTAPEAPPSSVPAEAPAEMVAAPEPRGDPAFVAASADRSPEQSARYYSVHRQNGRRPDPLEMPDPTYVDAIAVTMPDSLASQDLAQPQDGPTLIRDAQGRIRAQPAAPEGDYQ